MELATHTDASTFRISISGRFTFHDNNAFRLLLKEIENTDQPEVALDIASLEYIDSSGLGMLLLLRELTNEKQLTLTLNHATGQPMQLFEISRFNEIFTMLP